MSKRVKKWISSLIVVCLLVTMIPMTIVGATESDEEQNIPADDMDVVSIDNSNEEMVETETSEDQMIPEESSEETMDEVQKEDKEETEEADTETEETEETPEDGKPEETPEDGETEDDSHTEHDYACEFIWSEDYTSCLAKLTCSQCGETQTVDCEVSLKYSSSSKYYEARAVVDDVTWYDQHMLVDVYFEWNENYSQCTATVNDYENNETYTKECVVSSEVYENNNTKLRYQAEVEYDQHTYYDYRFVTNPAAGTNNGRMWYQYNEGCIDIRGFRDNQLIQTSFDDKYYTVLRVDEEDNRLSFTGDNEPVTVNGLSVTPQLSFSNNGNYVVVTYTVENNTASQKTFSLNFNSDVDIDTDDYATINITNTGIEMKNTETNTAYYVACKNVSGIKNVNTIWIGRYYDRWDNLFNNSDISSLSDTDSGFSAAWTNQTLSPGSTTTYSYEVGLGTGESIDAPEEHTHTYEPSFKWADDCSTCEVEFICSGCHASQNVNADVIVEKVDNVDNLVVYTASVNYNGKEYTETRTNAIIEILEDSTDGTATIATHIVGSGDSISLWCNIPLEYFVSVEVDGQVVDPNNYTLKSGSTILTFSSSYLDTLRSGTHEVKMNYNINGRNVVVSTNIKIVNKHTDTTQDPTPVKPDDSITTVKYSPVKMVTNIVDKDGNLLTGYILEIDSTSKTAVINGRGEASFNGMDAGDHTLYLKDSEGNVIASKQIKIVWADSYSIKDNVIYVKGNQYFELKVKYNGQELILLSVGPVSNPQTGDNNSLWIWITLVCISGILISLSRKRTNFKFSKK